jgi:hypothetical protein
MKPAYNATRTTQKLEYSDCIMKDATQQKTCSHYWTWLRLSKMVKIHTMNEYRGFKF